ncbi:MAG: type II toxin-antitoxin system death-on-curing family toxin [Anaerolineae bacterium]
MIRYITVDELIYINEQVAVSDEKIHTIVEGKRAVRDIGLLDAAAARPASSAFGQDAYPTLQEKAAILLHAIARNHPFADGNKRTATIGALLLLAVNGLKVTWQAEDALARIIATAEGKTDARAFAEWLPVETCERALVEDAARDMAIINELITDHAWLLNELAVR